MKYGASRNPRVKEKEVTVHYWQNQLWSGCLAASSDEVGQVRDSGLVRDSEPSAKVVPEAEAELGTGLSQAEEGVPAIASGVAAGSAADLAPGNLGPDVVLRSVGVQRDLGVVEHPQEFRLVGVQPCKQPVQDDEAGPTRKEAIKPRPQFGPSSRGRLSSVSLELEFGHSGWVAQCRNQAVENGSFHFRDVGDLT